ncbi:MAG: hypothetical protein EGQ52_05175 [Prevotella sp.]|nr:hypothetical protein [Prevotella sp.]
MLISKKNNNFTANTNNLKTTIMYHLTQTQALVLVVVLLIVFLVRSTAKAVNKFTGKTKDYLMKHNAW